jgi:hypothetical protein
MNPDQTINLNQNAADCIKAASKFGETIYTNICNGNVSHVAWGGVDWLAMIGISSFGLAFTALLFSFAIMVIRD